MKPTQYFKDLAAVIRTNDGVKKILANISWLAVDKGLRIVVGLAIGVLIARYLEPEQYGVYSYALTFVAMFMPLANMGLKSITIREMVKNPERQLGVLGTTFGLMLGASIFTFLLICGVTFYLRPNDVVMQVLILSIGLSVLLNAFQTIPYYFESQVLSKFTVYSTSIAYVVSNLLKLSFIILNLPVIWFGIASFVEILLATIGYIFVFRKRGLSIFKWDFKFEEAKKLMRDSYPLLISAIMISFYLKVDQIMLGELTNDKEVGIYAVAMRIAEMYHLLPILIVSSVYPSIVEAKEISESLFYGRLTRLFRIIAFLSLSAILFIFLFGNWVIIFLFGEAYAAASEILNILILTGIFLGFATARAAFLLSMNWTKVFMMIAISGCIINVSANYYLIPIYGGIGAAYASLAAHAFAGFFSCFLYKPLWRIGKIMAKSIIYPIP